MKTQQPNLEAAEFFLMMLDMEVSNLYRFTARLRQMGEWPQGLTPLYLADAMENFMGCPHENITGIRLVLKGEEL